MVRIRFPPAESRANPETTYEGGVEEQLRAVSVSVFFPSCGTLCGRKAKLPKSPAVTSSPSLNMISPLSRQATSSARQVNVISRFERGTHGTHDIGDREFPFCNVIVLLIAQWAPGAAVFKTFNTTGFNNMADLSGYPDTPVMFVAGDDSARKPPVLDLVRDIGFEAIDAGPLRIARLLEPFGMLWIDQALNRGAGRDFAFAVVRKR